MKKRSAADGAVWARGGKRGKRAGAAARVEGKRGGNGAGGRGAGAKGVCVATVPGSDWVFAPGGAGKAKGKGRLQ